MSLVDLHIYGKIGEESGVTTEPLTVTENGTYEAEEGKAYTPVTVNVPQPSGSISITENGTYDVADKAEAVVEVSGGGEDTLNAFINDTLETFRNNDITSVNAIKAMFNSKTALKTVEIRSIENFGTYRPFYGCTGLKKAIFTLLNTQQIDGAFENCPLEEWDFSAVTKMNLFCNNNASECKVAKNKIEFSDFPAVTSLASNAFRGYKGEEIAINATTIEQYSFYNCPNLKKIEIPKVTALGGNVFTLSPNIEELIIGTDNGGVVVQGRQGMLDGTKIARGNGYIKVPADLVDSYKSAQYWSTYASQIIAYTE